MRLVIISEKRCWVSPASASGYASDGGFPFQVQALSELFDSTTVVVPCSPVRSRSGEMPLIGHNVSIVRLSHPFGRGTVRKLLFPFWLLCNISILIREILKADAVHAPIPGDIATAGMLLGFFLRKPLFVRHCGNWLVQRTIAEHFWRWFMERYAGGRNVMIATGGGPQPPSEKNPFIQWTFSTTLTEGELKRYAASGARDLRDDSRLIIVCRQERYKGTEVLIRGLAIILKDFPKVSLDVVGDGSALDEFKRLAAALGVNDRVRFYGKANHEEVIRFLKQASIFCYPTEASEGFPKVVLEALACGLPVVTTKVSVLPQLIGRSCGLLLDKAEPLVLAKAIKAIFLDAENYRRMSMLAIETARGYSLEQWKEKIGRILEAAWGPLSGGRDV